MTEWARNTLLRPLSPALIVIPLVLMSLPLGLPNALSQSLMFFLLLPFIVLALGSAFFRPVFLLMIFGTLFVSIIQIPLNEGLEFSVYQALRAAIPFFLICTIVSTYRLIIARILEFLRLNDHFGLKLINIAMNVFCVSVAIQTLSFLSGFSLANALSSSQDNRVMIFQTTSCILLLYYAIMEKKYLMMVCLCIVVVGSGSKAIFAAAVVASSIALLMKFDFLMLFRALISAAILTGALFYVNPLVLERLSTFIESDEGEAFKDETREYEIEQAKLTFLRTPINTLLGAGFAMQLSPGVPTFDPAWAENSKYDIENGYWGVLAKLGVIFSALFLLLCVSGLTHSATTLTVLCIELVMFFKTSYQIFCYMDGVCILLWGIILEVCLRMRRHPIDGGNGSLPWRAEHRLQHGWRATFRFNHRLATAFALSLCLASAFVFPANVFASNAGQGDPPTVVLIHANDVVSSWDAPGAKLVTKSVPSDTSGYDSLLAPSIGWREYSIFIERGDWYRLDIPGLNRAGEVGISVNPISSGDPLDQALPLIGLGELFWLDSGAQRLRLVQRFWSPHVQTLVSVGELHSQSSLEDIGLRLISDPSADQVYRRGGCEPLILQAGGANRTFDVKISTKKGAILIATQNLTIQRSVRPTETLVSLECDSAGDYTVEVSSVDVKVPKVVAKLNYAVFETELQKPDFHIGAPIQTLDTVVRPPDYGSGNSRIVTNSNNTYRQSGPTGMPGTGSPPVDWFGYRISGLTPGQGYFLEVNYPDDAPRAFVVAIRDVVENGYPPSIGINTGGAWPLTGKIRTAIIPFWPQSEEARLVVFNYITSLRAAISSFRIRTMVETHVPDALNEPEPRGVAFWYEEGERFRDIVGQNSNPQDIYTAVDRYLRILAFSGVNTLLQSSAVYGYQLFPFQSSIYFNSNQARVGRALMLGAERYGIKVALELHPRLDEVLQRLPESDLRQKLLLSSDGDISLVNKSGSLVRPPLFNFIDKYISRLYLNYLSSIAETYKGSKSFSGIQLRISDWRNPALNNFSSISWGYNSAITEKFYKDTQIVPDPALNRTSDGPHAVRRRAEDILSNYRDQWVQWRCDQVTMLVREAVALMRQSKSDLSLYLNVVGLNGTSDSGLRIEQLERLREAGVDVVHLSRIDGVKLIDAHWNHGPHSLEDALNIADVNMPGESIYTPEPLLGQNSMVLWPMVYYEIRASLWPGSSIEIPGKKISPWISASMEPSERNRLARYAALLAGSDPFLIGDGGNNLPTIAGGVPDFMTEFRALPARPFARLKSVSNDVALRCSGRECYVVSLLPFPQRVSILAGGASELTPIRAGDTVTLIDGSGDITLDAFGLFAFSVRSGMGPVRPEIISVQRVD